jgi:hypothetical protein
VPRQELASSCDGASLAAAAGLLLVVQLDHLGKMGSVASILAVGQAWP